MGRRRRGEGAAGVAVPALRSAGAPLEGCLRRGRCTAKGSGARSPHRSRVPASGTCVREKANWCWAGPGCRGACWAARRGAGGARAERCSGKCRGFGKTCFFHHLLLGCFRRRARSCSSRLPPTTAEPSLPSAAGGGRGEMLGSPLGPGAAAAEGWAPAKPRANGSVCPVLRAPRCSAPLLFFTGRQRRQRVQPPPRRRASGHPLCLCAFQKNEN